MSLSGAQISDYLYRLRMDVPERADFESLLQLQRNHLLHVPFENLDIQRGRAIALDIPALFKKIVTLGRGGFCYELNGLFAQLLSGLGFRATLLSAEVATANGTFGPPFDHLLLRVDLVSSYIVDVGFGDAFSEPLELVADVEQSQGQKIFRLLRREGRWELHSRLGSLGSSAWKAEYRFTLSARELESFAAMCQYHQTSASSHFTQARICTIETHEGRLTVSGNRFIERVNGIRSEREIRDEAELEWLLKEHFGICRAGDDVASE
ncbi:MAG: arylamine N-acetyltransferase [Candidatus Velthaea sp.]